MGILRTASSERQVPLATRMLIGRSRQADLMIDGTWMSAEHAVLSWSGQGWQIRDLGSRNGTAVNGRRLRMREECPLQRGATISFGQTEEAWVLDDAGPPVPFAQAANKAIRVAVDDVLVLPDEAHAWGMIWQKDGRWQLRDANGVRRILDRDTVVLGGESWHVRLPEPLTCTAESTAPIVVTKLRLHLTASRDLETITVAVLHEGTRIGIETRSHHEVILLLARQHQHDTAADTEPAERGWIEAEELARMLNTTRDHLNVHIARIRKQFIACGVMDGHDIIERRRAAGQLRLAPIPVHIEP